MRDLSVPEVVLFLEDLLENRREALTSSAAGREHEPLLEEKLKALMELPLSARRKPLAELLTEADELHDAFGSGLERLTRALKELPCLTYEDRAAAERIRKGFVPNRAVLSASYGEEAENAKEHRPLLDELEEDLKRFPLPAGSSLYDVAVGFVDNGELLGELMFNQPPPATPEELENAEDLRVQTIRMIDRLRASITEEVAESLEGDEETRDEESSETGGRVLEREVFGYLDELPKGS